MKYLISKETESDLLKLGLYQVLGGLLGFVILIWNIYKRQVHSNTMILSYVVAIGLFAYSIFCGSSCIKARKNCLPLSLINQILQLTSLAFAGFVFKYTAGLYFTLGVDLSGSTRFTFGFGLAKASFLFNGTKELFEIDINIIALFLIIWIDKLMKQANREVELRENSIVDIGKT